jgi:ABC-2 type transport system ATP-binding protein
MDMIEVDGLTKRYGDKAAVDGLSLVVEPGVVTGFLGPNGAGKSTTMRMIAGLDRPTSGMVRVNGKHYPQAAAASLAEAFPHGVFFTALAAVHAAEVMWKTLAHSLDVSGDPAADEVTAYLGERRAAGAGR